MCVLQRESLRLLILEKFIMNRVMLTPVFASAYVAARFLCCRFTGHSLITYNAISISDKRELSSKVN